MLDARVYIVDDDDLICGGLQFLLMAHEVNSRKFADGRDFLDAVPGLSPGVVLLDIRMRTMDGIQTLRELEPYLHRYSVIMMTGHADVSVAVQAMKLGATDFVEKPFDESKLLETVRSAWRGLMKRSRRLAVIDEAHSKIDQLTTREKDVLLSLMGGYGNKSTAQKLGVSPRTIEMHRSRIFSKLQVSSLSDAIEIATYAGLNPFPMTIELPAAI